MSRTRSVSDAWAVSAARPMTKATAAGPAFRVREIRRFGRARRLLSWASRIRRSFVVHDGRFALPRARIKTSNDPFISERTCSLRKIAAIQHGLYQYRTKLVNEAVLTEMQTACEHDPIRVRSTVRRDILAQAGHSKV